MSSFFNNPRFASGSGNGGNGSSSSVYEKDGVIKYSPNPDNIFIDDNGLVFFSKDNANATIEIVEDKIYVRKVI